MKKGLYFTLVKGTPHIDSLQFVTRRAFTLAEVLITLAIVGVVAALTIPTLLATISNKVKNSQITVITRKIQKGTDLLNINNGIGPYYDSTRAFLTKLSQHMKISTICDSGEDMKNCFPAIVSTSEGEVDITKVKDGSNFGLSKDDYPDVAGVILGDGTPMIVAWNKNCPLSDPDTVTNDAQGKTYECLSGFMDLNGFKGANTISADIKKIADIVAFNHASGLSEGGNGVCLFKLASGKCLIAPPNEYKPMSYSDCREQKDILGLESCPPYDDYYAGAAKACGGKNKIASESDLQELAQDIYKVPIEATNWTNVNIDTETLNAVMSNLGLQSGTLVGYGFSLWSSTELVDHEAAAVRVFDTTYTYNIDGTSGYHQRYYSGPQVLCVGD